MYYTTQMWGHFLFCFVFVYVFLHFCRFMANERWCYMCAIFSQCFKCISVQWMASLKRAAINSTKCISQYEFTPSNLKAMVCNVIKESYTESVLCFVLLWFGTDRFYSYPLYGYVKDTKESCCYFPTATCKCLGKCQNRSSKRIQISHILT